jgi:hypothetical protein
MHEVYWLESLKYSGHLENLGTDGKTAFKWTLGNMVRGYGLESSGSVPVANLVNTVMKHRVSKTARNLSSS